MPVRWVPWSNRLYLAITYPDSVHSRSITILDCNIDSIIASGVLANDGRIHDILLDPVRERTIVTGVNGTEVYVLRDTGCGITAERTKGLDPSPGQTIVRGILPLPGTRDADLLDITGCRVMDLQPGENDISRLSPGVYFVIEEVEPSDGTREDAEPRIQGSQGSARGLAGCASSARKIVVQR